MIRFMSSLYILLSNFQQKFSRNKRHSQFNTSVLIGFLLAMNVMVLSYLLSFIIKEQIVYFLRYYYIFLSLGIIIFTVALLKNKKTYIKMKQLDPNLHPKTKGYCIFYIILSIISYAISTYMMFNDMYFS